MSETLGKLDLLSLFVDKCSDPRPALKEPWADAEGTFAYASNGHWMVRVPMCAELAGLPKYTAGAYPKNAAELFATAHWERLTPMAPLPSPEQCPNCAGTGMAHTLVCPCCGGEGEFEHYDYWYGCRLCDGNGEIKAPKSAPGAVASGCGKCNGQGVGRGGDTLLPIGVAQAQAAYVWRISQLPNVSIAPGESKLSLIGFRFTCGEGVLMPYRQHEELGA
ncbi:MAG: hypothetical protein ACTS8S_11085 [Giesbergeria sp.]